ncbi:hypothetical protein [Methylobacterium sp. OAE515]
MMEHLTEEVARSGVGLIFRGLVGFDEALHEMLRGRNVVAERR